MRDTYNEMLDRLDGRPAEHVDPDTSRCSTLDGMALEPLEAAANSLSERIRRVLVDAHGVVIDQGRARSFTGSAHRDRDGAWHVHRPDGTEIT